MKRAVLLKVCEGIIHQPRMFWQCSVFNDMYFFITTGIHGWIVYCLVGLLLGLMTYREGLPMTMKSCFYPLIGDRIFGWMGDLIDTVSILTTLFGVCTSLGLGTRQLNSGLSMINPNIPPDDLRIQVNGRSYIKSSRII